MAEDKKQDEGLVPDELRNFFGVDRGIEADPFMPSTAGTNVPRPVDISPAVGGIPQERAAQPPVGGYVEPRASGPFQWLGQQAGRIGDAAGSVWGGQQPQQQAPSLADPFNLSPIAPTVPFGPQPQPQPFNVAPPFMQGQQGAAPDMSQFAPQQPPLDLGTRPMTQDETLRQQQVMSDVRGGFAGQGAPPKLQGKYKSLETIADGMGLQGGERTKFLNETLQELRGKEFESEQKAKGIVKGLRDQGMTNDEIREAIGVTDDMTYTDAYGKLSALKRSKDKAIAQDPKSGIKANYDKSLNNAEFKTVTGADGQETKVPANPAARAIGLIERANSMGEDPSDDGSLFDYMSESQKSEFKRNTRLMAGNAKMSKKMEEQRTLRMNKALDEAERKRTRKFAKKQEKRKEDERKAALQKARGTIDDKKLKNLFDERGNLYKRLEKYDKLDGDDDAQAKLMSPEQALEIRNRIGQIDGITEAFNSGVALGAEAATQQPDANGFIVGKQYQDANGNTSRYLGNGKWGQ